MTADLPHVVLDAARHRIEEHDQVTPPRDTPAAADLDLDLGPVAQLRRAAISTSALKNIPPPTALIDDVLMVNTLAQVWGPPGCGKSFLTASWACHIATGTPWGPHGVRHTNVIYVVAEGAIGMGERIEAWERYHRVTVPEDALIWLPLAIQLASFDWADALAQFAQENQGGLIVVDTRARCTVGVEENSSKEMGVVVDHLEHIRETTESCVLLVHHGNAAGTKDRGSTVVLGAVETSLSMTKDGVVKLEKQKNAPDGIAWPMTKEPAGSSIVYLPNAGRDTTDAEPAGVGDALDTLRDLFVGDAVSTTTWCKASGLAERTFYKAAGWLLENGHVEKPAKGRWVLPETEENPSNA